MDFSSWLFRILMRFLKVRIFRFQISFLRQEIVFLIKPREEWRRKEQRENFMNGKAISTSYPNYHVHHRLWYQWYTRYDCHDGSYLSYTRIYSDISARDDPLHYVSPEWDLYECTETYTLFPDWSDEVGIWLCGETMGERDDRDIHRKSISMNG